MAVTVTNQMPQTPDLNLIYNRFPLINFNTKQTYTSEIEKKVDKV